MPSYTVRTPDQLSTLLRAFRKEAGLTQREVAQRMGMTQQTYSALERKADTVGAARLLRLLHILGVEWTMARPSVVPTAVSAAEPPPAGGPKLPDW